MEFSKQGQSTMPNNLGSQPVPSSNVQSNPPEYASVFYPSLPGDWGSQPMFSVGSSVPVSSYYIVPMSQQSVQVGASRPEVARPLGTQPLLSRVSLRPPQQVLNIQTSLPAMVGSQPSPATAGRKSQQAVASPKVQMLKSPSFQSSNKRSAQKEPPSKVQPQQLESVRSKFRESLAAALSLDSDQQNKCQSPDNVQPDGSADKSKPAGDAVQDPVAITSKDVSTVNSDVAITVVRTGCEGDEKLSSDLISNMITSVNDDMSQQSNLVCTEEELLGQCMVTDELLQGHGLSWVSDDTVIPEPNVESNLKRPRTSNVEPGATESLEESESKRIKSANALAKDKEMHNQKAESLAFRIEEELFKLFGGVNKKYKERGRSLLFNLKDKSNPELRERVLSGDIAPKRLCSMTAEELASKELSEWRLAKAEELAQMVVLPNTEVDPRRLVRKTHKGEFQVEVEEPDGISMEVELGSNLTNIPSKAVEDQTKSNEKSSVDGKGVQEKDKASDSTSQDEDGRTGNNDMSRDLEYIDNEKADLMQELILDDVKDTENLPPIPSLDEFMQGLDSEPPFVELSVGTPQEDGNDSEEPDTTLEPEELPGTKDKASTPEKSASESDKPSTQDNNEPKLESPGHSAVPNSDLIEPRDGEPSKSSPGKDEATKTATDNISNPDSIIQTKATNIPMIRESIWEGAIQLTVSSLSNVFAFFKRYIFISTFAFGLLCCHLIMLI